jgi:hypothetical protein
MLVDIWKGLGVDRSDVLLHWTAQSSELLDTPGTGLGDKVDGIIPGVDVAVIVRTGFISPTRGAPAPSAHWIRTR